MRARCRCRCPNVHQKKMSKLAGMLSVLETLSDLWVIAPVLLLSFIFGLTLVFADAVMPCFNCRDFRASAVHELGHLLSLEHPTGADGAIPLIKGSTPPPPPPPLNASTGAILPGYNQTEQDLLLVSLGYNYTGTGEGDNASYCRAEQPRAAACRPPPCLGAGCAPVHLSSRRFARLACGRYYRAYKNMYEPTACGDPFFGIEIDPAVAPLLAPPSPYSNVSSPPPPPTPPNPPADPGGAAAVNDTSFENKMGLSFWGVGTLVAESVMVRFGSIGLERPAAGAARLCLAGPPHTVPGSWCVPCTVRTTEIGAPSVPHRCLAQDDLDGINFLYPSCGVELPELPCGEVTPFAFVSMRLLEQFVKLMTVPLAIVIGVKLLAYATGPHTAQRRSRPLKSMRASSRAAGSFSSSSRIVSPRGRCAPCALAVPESRALCVRWAAQIAALCVAQVRREARKLLKETQKKRDEAIKKKREEERRMLGRESSSDSGQSSPRRGSSIGNFFGRKGSSKRNVAVTSTASASASSAAP